MTEESTALAAEQDTNQAASEAAVSSQGDVRDYEAEARASGWVPEAEWKGEKRPSKFLDAKTFVERGEELTPFIRKENKRLQERQERLEKTIERNDRMAQRAIEIMKTQYEEQIARIQGEKEAAVEAGDVAEYKRLDKQEKKLSETKFDEPEKPVDTKQATIEAWQSTNDWYGKDEDLTVYAEGYSQKLAAENPSMALADNLKKVEAKVKAMFPAKFGSEKKTATNGHAAVDGGGAFPGTTARADPLGKLSGDERAQARKDMERFPKAYPTAEAWLKAYKS